MKLFIDAYTITEEEINFIINNKFTNWIVYILYSNNIDENDAIVGIRGDRFDSIYLSRCSKNLFIQDCMISKLNDLTFILIDDKPWNHFEGHVSAKVKNLQDFFNGKIVTLFGEKLSFNNDYEKSLNLSSYIYCEMKFERGSYSNTMSLVYDAYSLGRYFNYSKKADDLDTFTKKIITKKNSGNYDLKRHLKQFYVDGLNFFNYKINFNYDMICTIPCKSDQENRFSSICEDNILEIKNDYNSITKYNASERKEMIKDVFKIKDEVDITGKNILVFDDIVTTGATLSEAVYLLYSKGAKKVVCLTMGKTFQPSYNSKNFYLCDKCNSNLKLSFFKRSGNPFIICESEKCDYHISIFNSFIYNLYSFLYNI